MESTPRSDIGPVSKSRVAYVDGLVMTLDAQAMMIKTFIIINGSQYQL